VYLKKAYLLQAEQLILESETKINRIQIKLTLRLCGICLLLIILPESTFGQIVELNPLFSDHLVLQQNTKAAIWGKTEPKAEVIVSGSWGKHARILADMDGNWRTELQTPKAGGPFDMMIATATDTVRLNDVLVGEVWLCSGQSNMEMPLKGFLPNEAITGSREAIRSADFPEMRVFKVSRNVSAQLQSEVDGSWSVCTPETAGEFSATAFFFGRKLHETLNIPIGLIQSSWGGTPAEAWTDVEALKEVTGFQEVEEKLEELKNPLSDYNVWMNQLEKIDTEEIFHKYEDLIDPEYASEHYNDSHWDVMQIPNWLEDEFKNYDGVIWFRKSFELSEVDENVRYNLSLGGIDDEDITFINGVEVGVTRNWTVQRNYSLPPGLLRKGYNSIAIRLFDGASNGGIYGGQKFGIQKDDKLIADLSGDWKYLPTALLSNNQFSVFTAGHSYKDMPTPSLVVNSNLPTGLYNAMIHPLHPFAIKGVIWYQGENNVGRAEQYKTLFPAMIHSWRKAWGQIFPFYFVQIAPYPYSGAENSEAAELRFAQHQTLTVPKTGQAVTLDIGSKNTIHPPNKEDVGERLARWALAKDYGHDKVAYSGPVCIAAKKSWGRIILLFDPGADKLVAGDEGLQGFEVVYPDGSVSSVKASLRRNKVVLSLQSGQNPIEVRYAWKNSSTASLFNSAGLPASTFSIIVN
jgi:sialate O-acetylesterase